MDNVVTVIFDIEAEAYKAFSEIKGNPAGTDYNVVQAALLKRGEGGVEIAEAIDVAGLSSNDTGTGMVIGSIVGILGGPLGVLLGAFNGALIGGLIDSADTVASASMMEVTAAKLYEGETAIIALVKEEEPAFDAAFEGYETIIIRHTSTDVVKEVEYAAKLEEDLANQAREKLRAQRRDSAIDTLAGMAEEFETEVMAANKQLDDLIDDAMKKPEA